MNIYNWEAFKNILESQNSLLYNPQGVEMSSTFSPRIPVWRNYLSTNEIYKTHPQIKLSLTTLENSKCAYLIMHCLITT